MANKVEPIHLQTRPTHAAGKYAARRAGERQFDRLTVAQAPATAASATRRPSTAGTSWVGLPVVRLRSKRCIQTSRVRTTVESSRIVVFAGIPEYADPLGGSGSGTQPNQRADRARPATARGASRLNSCFSCAGERWV